MTSTALVPTGGATLYRQSVEEVLLALGTDPERGLSGAEAGRRLEEHGRNELTADEPVPGWLKFLAQFKDVLVVLLLIAAGSRPSCGPSSVIPPCPSRRWRSSPSCCSTG